MKMSSQLLVLFCAALFSLPALSQCDIDFEFGDVAFGVSPDPAAGETFLDGMLEEDYYDVLHILIPATAAGIDSSYTTYIACGQCDCFARHDLGRRHLHWGCLHGHRDQ